MDVRWGIKTVLVIAVSALLIIVMGQRFYGQWAGYLAISAIPAMVMIDRLWPAADGAQPRSGLIRLALSIAAGAVVAAAALHLFQDGGTPNLVTVMYVIMSVVVTMWLVLAFEVWPLDRLAAKNPVGAGLALLGLAYVLAYLLLTGLFDFTTLGLSHLAPAGLFPAWTAIVFAIMTLAVMFALGLAGQMPLCLAIPQPGRGLVTAGLVLVLAAIFMLPVFFGVADPVAVMVAGPISFLFGVFIVTDLADGRVLSHWDQPARGLALVALSGVAGYLLYHLYGVGLDLIAPGQPLGPPSYARELWLANAMLSITFPVILIHARFFGGWPIGRPGITDNAPQRSAA